MNRIALAVLVVLCACAKDGGRSAEARSDSAAPAAPSGMMGAPARAQQGVEGSNAAQQQRVDQINALSDTASGATQP